MTYFLADAATRRQRAIRQKFKALEGQLDLLEPTMPPDEALEVMAMACRDPAQNPVFARAFSFTCAKFRESAYNDIYRCAARHDHRIEALWQSDMCRFNGASHADVKPFLRAYVENTDRLHIALTGDPDIYNAYATAELGTYRKPRALDLHVDFNARHGATANLNFVGRVNLPTRVVSGAVWQDATPEVAAKIREAREEDGEMARQWLGARRLLCPLRDGTVSVFLSDKFGTLHCSSVIEQADGVPSGFFFAVKPYIQELGL